MHGSNLCHMHDPARAEERRSRSSKGGRRGGVGRPMARAREAEKAILGAVAMVEAGALDPDRARAMFAGYRVAATYLELGRRLEETEVLVAEVQALRTAFEEQRAKLARVS